MASEKRRRTPTPMREVKKSPVVSSDAPLPSVHDRLLESIIAEPDQPIASTSKAIPQLTVTSPGSSGSAQEHPANKPDRLSVSPSPEPPTPEVSPPAPKRPRRQATLAKGKAPALEVVAKRIRESTPGRRSRESSVASSTGAPKLKKKAESRKSSAAPVNRRRATRQSNTGDKKLAVLAFPTRRELNAATGIGSGRRRTDRLADKVRDDCNLPCTPLWALVGPSTSDFDPTTLRESAARWHDESD